MESRTEKQTVAAAKFEIKKMDDTTEKKIEKKKVPLLLNEDEATRSRE